ncbi:DUF2171 domain-containing protein [Dankookia sp. P2]|uniref:DUF2171 domain-containing protein n=1 Tax=Dankookia sp. P2 TaxID=3423955 RepID=UPI003D673578
MTSTGEIRPHMEIIGADGGHVGTVDRLRSGHIRLTRADDPDGSGSHHHALPLHLVDRAEAGQVRLTVTTREARAMAVGGLRLADVREGAPDDETPGEAEAGAAPHRRETRAGSDPAWCMAAARPGPAACPVGAPVAAPPAPAFRTTRTWTAMAAATRAADCPAG